MQCVYELPLYKALLRHKHVDILWVILICNTYVERTCGRLIGNLFMEYVHGIHCMEDSYGTRTLYAYMECVVGEHLWNRRAG